MFDISAEKIRTRIAASTKQTMQGKENIEKMIITEKQHQQYGRKIPLQAKPFFIKILTTTMTINLGSLTFKREVVNKKKAQFKG